MTIALALVVVNWIGGRRLVASRTPTLRDDLSDESLVPCQ